MFPEELKATVRKQSHYRCCLCRRLGIEIHHIIPLAEGGSDDEDNAAPLCPSCHDIYGANTEKRKFIRETRDFWYRYCSDNLTIPTEQLKAISDTLKTVATKDDISRLSIQNSSYLLGDKTALPWEHLRYSFMRVEFVHPLIVRELLGWLSDSSETITSVDLVTSNKSSRFFGDFSTFKENGRQWVEWKNDQHEYFIYSHVATSPSGIHILECHDCGGGSGVFGSIAFLVFESDRCLIESSPSSISTRERVLLKTLGSMSLGDRYSGEISYRDGTLIIGADKGWFNRGEETYREVPIS